MLKTRLQFLGKLVLPEYPEGKEIYFSSPSGLLLAIGYERVVVGDRGAYIEFTPEQIMKDNIFIPEEAKFRLTHPDCYYIEWQSKCPSKVFIYDQRKKVAYADYIPYMFYIHPSLLTSNIYKILYEENN